jgi:hypothetical protein
MTIGKKKKKTPMAGLYRALVLYKNGSILFQRSKGKGRYGGCLQGECEVKVG